MKTLEKFIGTSKQPTFAEFRKFVLYRYEARFINKPELKALIEDVDYEGNVQVITQLFTTFQDVKEALPEFHNYRDFLIELDETFMHDYFVVVNI